MTRFPRPIASALAIVLMAGSASATLTVTRYGDVAAGRAAFGASLPLLT